MKYNKKSPKQKLSISATLLLSVIVFLLIGGLMFAIEETLAQSRILKSHLSQVLSIVGLCWRIALGCGAVLLIIAAICYSTLPKTIEITRLVENYLLSPGNPLDLKHGERLPRISCSGKVPQYVLKVETKGFTTDKIKSLASGISSALVGRVSNYAVTTIHDDPAKNSVNFLLEDVTIDHHYTFSTFDDFFRVRRSLPITQLFIQDNISIDLTNTTSILLVGRTRSGKSTAAGILLCQTLLPGRDQHNSMVLCIDPKRGEFCHSSPYVVVPDKDGGGRKILAAMQRFDKAAEKRQEDIGKLFKDGHAEVHWWEAGFYPSFLFLDELVALRALFPKRAEKEDPEYCLATFDNLLKRIITMRASAGCFVIISVAQASVEEGGLPSMLKEAIGTKILFRPTVEEGRFLWSSSQLQNMSEREYQAGEAWFTSTDGMHDNAVRTIRFPEMDFSIYKELGRLFTEYYEG